MRKKLSLIVLVLCSLLFAKEARAQITLPITETFDESWSASAGSIALTTGTWTYDGTNAPARNTSTVYSGAAGCKLGGGAYYLITPQFATGGAGTLTFYMSAGGTTTRYITVYKSSTDTSKTSFTFVGKYSSSATTFSLVTVAINDGNTKYLKFKDSTSSVYIDQIALTSYAGAPIITTTPASNITISSAACGGTVTSANGASVTTEGVYYGTDSASTTSVASTGTATPFTVSVSGLTANTAYYCRAYATNGVGTGTGYASSFITLPDVPIIGAASNESSIGFTAGWSVPAVAGSALYTYTLAYGTDITFTLSDSIKGISSGSLSQNISGLNISTTYYYRVKAVNATGSSVWSAVDSAMTTGAVPAMTISSSSVSFANTEIASQSVVKSVVLSGNFLSPDAGTIAVTAPSGFEVSADSGTFGPSASYSYASSTLSSTKLYIRFAPAAAGSFSDTVKISGGTAPDQIVVVSGTGLDHPTTTLASIDVAAGQIITGTAKNVLYQFTVSVSNSTALAVLTNINFTTSGSYAAGDITNLKLWRSTSNTLSAAAQNSSLTSSLDAGAHAFASLADTLASGSTVYFWITADVASGATAGDSISIATIAAADLTTATGTVVGSTSAGAAHTVLTASLTADYFRSAATGIWSAVSTWESSSDSVTWHAATLVPTSSAASVTIVSGHSVTMNAATSIGKTFVNNGGTLALSTTGTLTVASGTLTVNGTLVNYYTGSSSPFTLTGTIVFGATGVYDLAAASTTTNVYVPTATWNTGSTCKISGLVGVAATDYGSLYGISQVFYNFVVDMPNMIGKLVLQKNVAITSVNGTFTVNSTGSGSLQTSYSTTGLTGLPVAKYIQNGGTVAIITNSTSTVNRSMTVSGSFALNDSSIFTMAQYKGATTGVCTLSVAGDVSIASGAKLQKDTVGMGGSFGTALLVLNGTSAAQTVTDSGSALNLISMTVNNANGIVLGNDLAVGDTLKLTSGNITTGSYTLKANTVSRTSGCVVGTLKKTSLAAAATFDVGTASGYTPVTITPTGSGDVSVSAVAGKHPSRSIENVLGMYWTIHAAGGITSANLTFKYLAADVNGAEASYDLGLWDGASWTLENKTADTTAHTITMTGATVISGDWTGVENIRTGVGNLADLGIPKTYVLSNNYPNPFNPSTTIQYGLPAQSKVTMKVYSVLGQELATLVDGVQGAGYHSAVWNASHAASGVYFFRLNAQGTNGASFVQIRKMVLMK